MGYLARIINYLQFSFEILSNDKIALVAVDVDWFPSILL